MTIAKTYVLIFIALTFLCSIQKVSALTEYIDIPLSEDTYIEEKFPTISPWNNRNLYLGTDTWYTKGKTRVLININFQQLQQHPVFYSDIESAELHATVYGYEGIEPLMTIDTYNTSSGWNMYTVNWSEQPSIISTKRDSTQITTTLGKKYISITKAVIDAYKNERGIMLKANPETAKAIILWAHGCEFAPTAPQCLPEENPYIRIFYTPNQLPSICELATPITNSALSTTSVSIKPKVSTDTENNPITYGARVCSDATCQQVLWQAAISPSENTVATLPEGSYQAQCYADDGHQQVLWGQATPFSVDTTKPLSPQMLTLPTVTGKNELSVAWIPSEHYLMYQVQYSQRESFSAYNQYTDWSPDLSAMIQSLEEKQYYVRVRAKDQAQNLSEWSPSATTTIDLTAPAFSYLKVSTALLNPHLTSANEIDGTAYIQAGFTDMTLERIVIRIYNDRHEIQYSEEIQKQSYIRTHWPDKIGYADGYYYLVAEAVDALGKNIFSPITVLEIDTTPPKEPLFTGITAGGVYAQKNISTTIYCEAMSSLTLYIGGKITGEGTTVIQINTALTDGAHTISAKCTDKAGNSSNKSLSITIDTTPPASPRFALSYDEQKKVLIATYTCREIGSLQFYFKGILRQEIHCTPGATAPVELLQSPPKGSYLSITARQADIVANWSVHSEESIYIPAISKDMPTIPEITCALTYNISLHQKVVGGCRWHNQDTAQIHRTEQTGQNTFRTYVSIAPQKKFVETNVTLIACKDKSFWDPRTWFSCVTERIGEEKVILTHVPLYRSSVSLTLETSNMLSTLHNNALTSLPINEKHLVYAQATVNGYSFSINELSSATDYLLSLTYPPNKDPRAFLHWFFSGPVPVTQWHGYTAYQTPHGGIDFGVAGVPITVPANGTITSSTYHKSSECFAGGYYIGIKHDNGLFTYYFHLQSTKNQQGIPITVGSRVEAGSSLAITGNSGMYNCEPLAHHLHFEVRSTPDPKNHLNPTPYIDVDWSTIYTAGISQNPGRLTGDNPHPTY